VSQRDPREGRPDKVLADRSNFTDHRSDRRRLIGGAGISGHLVEGDIKAPGPRQGLDHEISLHEVLSSASEASARSSIACQSDESSDHSCLQAWHLPEDLSRVDPSIREAS